MTVQRGQQGSSGAIGSVPREELGAPEAAWILPFASPLGASTRPGSDDARGDGPLAGLRFAVKDNIDVAGHPTTAACPAFARTASTHATVVQRLLDAGALCTGKTNLDQFACGLNGTRSPFGAVPNAFDPRYVSGGSSSGSAYVVATGAVDFALGTDTAGSGRVPAGLNNIVGIKPTRGLISCSGIVPAAQSVDCVSIFARTVADGARVLASAIGHDPTDPYSRPVALQPAFWPQAFRFGVPSIREFHGDTLSQGGFESALAQLGALGGRMATVDYRPLAEAAALLYDSALVAERYVAVRAFFDAHEDDVIEPVRGILAQGRRYSAADHAEALTRLRALGQQARAMWNDIDVLVVPTAPTHCTIAAMRADPIERNRRLGYYTNFVNLLDFAAIAVPGSLRADGLPFGITLIGPAGSDFALAALAQRFHHVTGLTAGATGRSLGEPRPLPSVSALPASGRGVRVAVVGAHLSGMPLNGQLLERGRVCSRARARHRTIASMRCPGRRRRSPGWSGSRPVTAGRSRSRSGRCRKRTTARSSRPSPRRSESAP